jgi:hypothetical protein
VYIAQVTVLDSYCLAGFGTFLGSGAGTGYGSVILTKLRIHWIQIYNTGCGYDIMQFLHDGCLVTMCSVVLMGWQEILWVDST